MKRASLRRLRTASGVSGPLLVLLAMAGGLSWGGLFTLPGQPFSDSFESWPAPWTTDVDGANRLDVMFPSADPNVATRPPGAWDGARALRVEYAGVPFQGSGRAEAVAASSAGLLYGLSLRLMLYVPMSTRTTLPANARLRIARLAQLPNGDDSANIGLYLRKGDTAASALYVEGEYLGPSAPVQLGTLFNASIAVDTWHTVELEYRPNATPSGGVVALYVDDPSTPRDSKTEQANFRNFSLTTVVVGLAGPIQATGTGGVPVVWWIDDVTLEDVFTGQGPPRLHLHQDGFEAPNVNLTAFPPGKSRVAAVGGSVQKNQSSGRRGAAAECVDQGTNQGEVSAIYGELRGADTASTGKLYHRVWWQAGTVNSSGQHPLVAITSADFLGNGPLEDPMAAISVRSDGSLALWGYSYRGAVKTRDAEISMGPPLGSGWHLLELEVVNPGTPNGQRLAFVDGQLTQDPDALGWPNVFPTQWVDGHLPDSLNTSFQGSDLFDDSRTSLLPQPSHFGLPVGARATVGVCTSLVIQAQGSLGHAPQLLAEDEQVAVDANGRGVFYSDPGCTTPALSFRARSGTSSFPVYFLAGPVTGDATIKMTGQDVLDHDSILTIDPGGQPDLTPPDVPGPAVPSALVTNGAVTVDWTGSRDEDGGTGLRGYDVEVNQNNGGWTFHVHEPAATPGAPGSIVFDGAESSWRFRVLARDNAGNVSAPGVESSPVIVDRTRPTPPALVSPTVDPGNTTATVTWTPATDNGSPPSGIQSYSLNVRELGTNLQTNTTLSVRSTQVPVTPGYRYEFRVSATDNAGNESGYSGVSEVRVPGGAVALRLQGLGVSPSVRNVGQPYTVQVEAVTAAGNVAPEFRDWIRFSAVSSSGSGVVDLPPGMPYQFTAADQGRHSFDAGVTFQAPGFYQVTVRDVLRPQEVASVTVDVTAITPGQVSVLEDANLQASPGIPYVYNATGAVQAVAATTLLPLAYSRCGGPSDFVVDPSTGAVQWTPQPSTNWPVSICVKATSTVSTSLSDTYDFDVQLATLGAPPVAAFRVTPSSPGARVPAQFDPVGSSANPGPPLFRWRFGDGSPLAFVQSPNPPPIHAYLLPGGYRPFLTVLDAAGRSAQGSQVVLVPNAQGNAPPSLTVQNTAMSGDDQLDATLSASVAAGVSPPGRVVWDLGNGAAAAGASVSGTYGPGRTWATAIVVDGNGLPSSDKVEIAVRRSNDVPPFCTATANPPVVFLPDPSAQRPAVWTSFRSPGSDEIDTVSWVIDGQSFTGANVQLTYGVNDVGWHHGQLTVEDDQGLQCTDSLWVVVMPPGSTGAVPPRLLDPGAGGAMECSRQYTGQPPVALGTGPLQWSLDAAESPQGMAVDQSTGVVTWTPDVQEGAEVSYVLQVSNASGLSDAVTVTVPYQCSRIALGTCGGCGAGSGAGAPAAAGMLLFALWAMARRRAAAASRSSASRPPGARPR